MSKLTYRKRWKVISLSDRATILNRFGFSRQYANESWNDLPDYMRKKMRNRG